MCVRQGASVLDWNTVHIDGSLRTPLKDELAAQSRPLGLAPQIDDSQPVRIGWFSDADAVGQTVPQTGLA